MSNFPRTYLANGKPVTVVNKTTRNGFSIFKLDTGGTISVRQTSGRCDIIREMDRFGCFNRFLRSFEAVQ